MVDQAAKSWNVPGDVHGDARLVLSELTTNACRLYPRQVLMVWVARPSPGVLEMGVWDPDPFTAPTRRESGESDESGRGLNLVAELSENWGWYPSPTTGGKVVWARLVW